MIDVREMNSDDDMNTVLGLCKDFFAEYEKHHEEFFDTDNLTDRDIRERFEKSLASPDSATIIAVEDNHIVGYASVAVHDQPRFYKIKRVGSISALMVAKEHRRRRIGGKIMNEARAFFERAGVKYYTFFTSVANRGAMELYQRLGLKPLHVSFLGIAGET